MSRQRWSIALLVILALALALPATLQAQDDDPLPVPPGRVLVGDDTGLYTVPSDDPDEPYLLEDGDDNCWLRDAGWSPDGARLIYTRICGGGSATNWRAVDADGNPDPNRTAQVLILEGGAISEPIPYDGTYQDYAGTWNPDPDRQEFTIFSNRNGGIYNIYLVNFLTGQTSQVTDFSENVAHVSWDPTGRYLLYNRYVTETDDLRWEVRALDLETGTETRVAEGLTPNWSPDGDWIIYATDGEVADVFVMPAACVYNNTPCEPQTAARNVTQTPNLPEREPLWTPDQSQIVYLRDTDTVNETQTWDVFRQEMSTGRHVQVTTTPNESERISAWEPIVPTQIVPIADTLPVILRVTSDNLNMRSGPGTNFQVLATMPNGQILFAQATNAAESWYKVTLPDGGNEGWVFGNLVTVEEGDPERLPEATE